MRGARAKVQEAGLALVLAAALAGCGHAPLREPLRPAAVSRRPMPPQELPGADWETYEVRPGDTLAAVARCRGVAASRLANANRLSDPDRILAGTALRVPALREPCAPSPAEAPPGVDDAAPHPQGGEASCPAVSCPAALGAESARARADELVAQARARYDGADFDASLLLARAAAELLEPHAGEPLVDGLRARAHLQAGLAAAGLEQRAEAVAELRAAFAADPRLALGSEDASPKIRALVAEAQPGSR